MKLVALVAARAAVTLALVSLDIVTTLRDLGTTPRTIQRLEVALEIRERDARKATRRSKEAA